MEKKEEEAALTSFRSLEVHVFQFFTLVNYSNIESYFVGKDISWGQQIFLGEPCVSECWFFFPKRDK